MKIVESWGRVHGVWGRYAAPKPRGLLGSIPLVWLVVLIVASIPLLVLALVMFLAALVITPVIALVAGIPLSVVYFLALRRGRRRQTTNQPIEVEYRVVSRDESD